MSIYGVFSYTQLKSKHHDQLADEVIISSKQLQDSIRPYIESFAPNEYLHLIDNEMKHGNILAIVIDDYQMGNILGQKSFTSGKIRNDQSKVIDYELENKEHQEILQNTLYKKTVPVLAQLNDEKIGEITVYGTDKFLQDELYQLVSENIIVTLLIYMFLIGGIYYGINLFMIDPIKETLENIEKTDESGIPLYKLQEVGAKEIVSLSSAINKMIDTVKDSRQKLQEQKEEFEMIFDSTQDGIAIVDLDSKFLQCNQAYLEMTGYTKEELLRLTCIGLTSPESRAEAIKRLEETIVKGHLENFEKECTVKDNKVIMVNISMNLLPDKQRILLTVKDVTNLKIIESQAKLASMGEMIGNIAHQWRQPLSIISTSASGAKIEKELGVLSDEVFNKHMDSIVKQTEYLSKTIDDFRNFIKDGANKTKPLQIVELLEKTLSLVESSFKNHYIEIVKNYESDMDMIGYENELIQALINILNNAKDAINENCQDQDIKVVFIETKKVGNRIEISIKDNGGGILPSIKDRLFEPYFTTKHQSIGTGIGLSLARSILTEHHNGKISINNEEFEYKGKKFTGASFKIIFEKNIDV